VMNMKEHSRMARTARPVFSFIVLALGIFMITSGLTVVDCHACFF